MLDPAKEPGGYTIWLIPILIVVKPHAALQVGIKGLEFVKVGMDTRLERSRLAILNDIVGTNPKFVQLVRGELRVRRDENTDVVLLEQQSIARHDFIAVIVMDDLNGLEFRPGELETAIALDRAEVKICVQISDVTFDLGKNRLSETYEGI